MYLDSLQGFNSLWVPHQCHIPTFTASTALTVWVEFTAWVPTSTIYLDYIHCVHCIYCIYCIHCIHYIHCIHCTLHGWPFYTKALSPPPCTYIHCNSLHGFQLLAWVTTTPMYLHSLHGWSFAPMALSPPPCTYIHCVYCITAWVQFTVWVPTSTIYLHWLCSMHPLHTA